ncbi:hypothetical protein TrLO_g14892 [Triparma laevis f. longispina]|uniref:Uncharacterized protein n=1 Tax=Triparma laevis f. longispina TaxID=1714387 RepID=A0A9W7FUL0_9STRA|nr:hypothetical protein TrLO_g14892 [Triparma laevis f. longispina]
MDQQQHDDYVSPEEADQLLAHIDTLEIELKKSQDSLAAAHETIEMHRLSVSQKTTNDQDQESFQESLLESQQHLQNVSLSSKLDPSYVSELEEIVTMLEGERSLLEATSSNQQTLLDKLQIDLMDARERLTSTEENLNQALQLAVPGVVGQGGGGGFGDDGNLSLSNNSSLASFHTGHQSSPGLTPRSERETEDIVAHFESLVKTLREENGKLQERAKKERAKRKKESEKFKFQLEQKDVKYQGLEILLNQQIAKNKELDSQLEVFRAEKQAAIKRTQAVVANAVRRGSGSGGSGGGNGNPNSEDDTSEWAVNNKNTSLHVPESELDDEEGAGKKKKKEKKEKEKNRLAWNKSPPNIGPPSHPPPQQQQRRKSHDRKWLNDKLQKMGLRDGSRSGRRVEPENFADESNTQHMKQLDSFWMGGGGATKGKVLGKHAKIGLNDSSPEMDPASFFSDV